MGPASVNQVHGTQLRSQGPNAWLILEQFDVMKRSVIA
jgi:hypothetical protein